MNEGPPRENEAEVLQELYDWINRSFHKDDSAYTLTLIAEYAGRLGIHLARGGEPVSIEEVRPEADWWERGKKENKWN